MEFKQSRIKDIKLWKLNHNFKSNNVEQNHDLKTNNDIKTTSDIKFWRKKIKKAINMKQITTLSKNNETWKTIYNVTTTP